MRNYMDDYMGIICLNQNQFSHIINNLNHYNYGNFN